MSVLRWFVAVLVAWGSCPRCGAFLIFITDPLVPSWPISYCPQCESTDRPPDWQEIARKLIEGT